MSFDFFFKDFSSHVNHLQADDLHKIPNLVFSEKKNLEVSATILLCS